MGQSLLPVVAIFLSLAGLACSSTPKNSATRGGVEDGGTAPDASAPEDAHGEQTNDAAKPLEHVVIPLTVQQKYANAPKSRAIAVPVEFASPNAPNERITLSLLLDTGSSGVSVFAESLGGVVLERVGAKESLTYGGGDVYEQQDAMAIVGLGGVRTEEAVEIAVVDDVHCASGTSCGGAAGPSYLTKQGFHGILGLGTRYQGKAFSPISRLPDQFAHAYQIDTEQGELILAPTEDDSTGFASYALQPDVIKHPNGAPTFDDRSLPICANVGTAIENDCAPGLIDSGVQSLFFAEVDWGDLVTPDGTLVANTDIDIELDQVFDWQNANTDNLYVSSSPFLGGFSRVLGMPFFQVFDVRYDLSAGTIGVR